MQNEEFREKQMSKEKNSLLDSVKQAKRKRNFYKTKELEIKTVKLKSANNPNILQSELKELNKIQFVNKKLHEVKQEILEAFDEGFDAEGAVFNGYVYEIDTPQFYLVNRSQYGNGCDFKLEIIENRGNI